MRLSELQTGEKAVIVKVLGHGSFRKRIVEMGFIRGQQVEVLLNAPLQDPVKYRLMNYEVSLRHEEAEQIEVEKEQQTLPPAPPCEGGEWSHQPDGHYTPLPHREGQGGGSVGGGSVGGGSVGGGSVDGGSAVGEVTIALVGNPNCGKTSLFNYASGAHARVGNYSGVTVDATEAHAHFFGYDFQLIDLPGTYSLSAYSPEELYVRRYIVDKTPDVVINVIDSSNLERNLYLTTQLIDMNVRVVCALNMFDEYEKRGDTVDLQVLSTLMGVPMVPTSFKTGRGVKELFQKVIEVMENEDAIRHIHIPHGHEVEDGIAQMQELLKRDESVRVHYSTRYLSIKLLENDKTLERYVRTLPNADAIFEARDHAARRIMEETAQDSETAIMDAKYGFIHGALEEAGYKTGTKQDTYRFTHAVDNVLSNRYVGFPIFFLILFVMFETTFVVGQYPMDWIEMGVEWLSEWVGRTMPDGMLKDMIVDGCIAGVGSVIVFLPQILILYLFISFMEDTGYMARAAFIMDKLMHKMGLHGKSFIPLVMGFGCNVPAVMATRTIESRRSRLITMMILPFMSCSARLPIYIMITGIFFEPQWRPLVMISLYAVGILVSILVSNVFSRLVLKGEDTPFVMELPPYRMPTAKAIGRHTWEKGKEYLKKMGGIILVASIIVWALGYFGTQGVAPSMEESFIGYIGRAIEPLFRPQGFNWQLDVSLIAGLGAKEIVASTIGVLGGLEGLSPLTAYCYLLFVLLYFPCIATIVAIKNETGSWRWAALAAIYTTIVAWVVSACVALFACTGSATTHHSVDGDTLQLNYAERLTIVEFDDYTQVTLADPWNEGKVLHTYLLVPSNQELPAHLPKGTVVRTPLQKSVIATSVHCGLLQSFGCEQSIGGVCDVQYIHLPFVEQGCQAGTIADCGSALAPAVEKILDLQPDAIFLSPFQNSGGYGRVEELGIPIVETADYMETSPLGRAEWMRFYGLLFGAEAEADSIFAQVLADYGELKEKAAQSTSQCTVMMDKMTGSVWYVPGGNSTIGHLIQDAHCGYAWSDDTHSGSLSLPFETVLEKAGDADVWLFRFNAPHTITPSELLSEHRGYSQFRAFQQGELYGCNTATSTFYEDTPFHPERLLRDFVTITHPELGLGEPKYFIKLKSAN